MNIFVKLIPTIELLFILALLGLGYLGYLSSTGEANLLKKNRFRLPWILAGLIGLAVDPDFARNHYLYVFYTSVPDGQDNGGPNGPNEVVRLTDVANQGTGIISRFSISSTTGALGGGVPVGTASASSSQFYLSLAD